MIFYQIDGAVQDAIEAADKPVRLKIDIQVGGHFEQIFEQDILSAHFWGLKEAAGGVSSRGEVIIDNTQSAISNDGTKPGSEVRVSFSIGEGLSYFQRFVFYLDDKGVQDMRGPGRKWCVRLGLLDLSYKLRKSDEAKDWTAPAIFAYSVVCDKSQPEKSLVHSIAGRAGLAVTDIDCSTVLVTLPYVKLTKNLWSELSSLATAYRCHLECTVEKPLVFAHSPYQSEELLDDEISHTFHGDDIFYYEIKQRADLYRNSIRLKVNMPVSLTKQEIWRYEDSPVFYDVYLQEYYPFRYPLVRKIEAWDYEARYRITESNGKERNVIYADEIDTKEEAENRLDYDGGPFEYFQYDIATNHDKAILKIHKENDGDLYHASIHGRPIVLDLNRSFFTRDDGEINQYGTVALNVTGAYFSDYMIGDRRQYEDWAVRELAERTQRKREFVFKTHRGLFHARVGAKVNINVRNEFTGGVINAFSFRYRKNKAFVAAFRIKED
jgi:hypothetical protein